MPDMVEFPIHVCPVCGVAFTPIWNIRLPDGRIIERERKTAIYDHPRCRLRHFRMKRAFKRAGVYPLKAGVSKS